MNAPAGPGRFPRTVFVSLWFPKPSETFVFREVSALYERGLPVFVFCLYDALKKGLSPAMRETPIPVTRLGIRALPKVIAAARREGCANPAAEAALADVLGRRWSCLEQFGENWWAGFCGFALAAYCREHHIEHIHAAWANGPATAAWVASRLTGIPFSFSARAGDVHPPDGALAEKLAAAAFARVDSSYNLPHLRRFIADQPDKVHLVYNARTLNPAGEAAVSMGSPVKLLAMGRFVYTKGFDYLIDALGILRRQGVNAVLTLAGDGHYGGRLKSRVSSQDLTAHVNFPGFVSHDQVARLILDSDILVMPSIRKPSGDSDGLPTVINEALYHRLPVVATDVASISDVIHHEQTGLLVPERDAAALVAAIKRLAADRDLALALASAGRDLAMRMFDPETCIGTMIALLEGRESTE